MSLTKDLKTKLTEARRSGNTLQMGVLQVILGDVSMSEGRTGKPLSDDEVENSIRKMNAGILESMDILEKRNITDTDNYRDLQKEKIFVATLLPQTLSVEAIKFKLAEIVESLKTAKNDGQATGLAVKHLKPMGLKLLGEDVSVAVKELRNASQ